MDRPNPHHFAPANITVLTATYLFITSTENSQPITEWMTGDHPASLYNIL